MVSLVFKEPIYKVLEKIKNEPYFKWPNKMGRDPTKRNQSLYNQYHQDRGHTTEDCRTLRDYLKQLVKVGKLKQFMHQSPRQGSQIGQGYQREVAPRLSLRTISIIFVTPDRESGPSSRVMSISSQPELGKEDRGSKRIKAESEPVLGFLNTNKVGTFQPYDDALVVTLRIKGFDVKRVMVDQGSGVEIMYPDLYKGLNLKLEDLSKYNSLSVAFDGRTMIPKGMIKLPV